MKTQRPKTSVPNALQTYRASPRTSQDKLRFAKVWLNANFPSNPAAEDRDLVLWKLVEYMTTFDFVRTIGSLASDKIEVAHEVVTKWEELVRQVAAADERDGLSAEEGRAVLSHIRNAAVTVMSIELLDDLTKLFSISVPEGFRERVMRDIAGCQNGEELRLDTDGDEFLGGELYDDACELAELVGYSSEEIEKNQHLWERCGRLDCKHPSWYDLPNYAGLCLEIHGPAEERIRRTMETSTAN